MEWFDGTDCERRLLFMELFRGNDKERIARDG